MVQVPFFFFEFVKNLQRHETTNIGILMSKNEKKPDSKISNETFFGTAEHMAQSSNVVWGEIKTCIFHW